MMPITDDRLKDINEIACEYKIPELRTIQIFFVASEISEIIDDLLRLRERNKKLEDWHKRLVDTGTDMEEEAITQDPFQDDDGQMILDEWNNIMQEIKESE